MRNPRLGCKAVLVALAALACEKSDSTPAATDGMTSLPADAGRNDSGPATDTGSSPLADTGSAPPADGPAADAAQAADAAPATDGPGGTAGPERFAGNWDYNSGQATLTCPGAQPLTQDLMGTFLEFRVGAGVAPLLLASPGCTLRFDIQGQTAVIQPGQTCMTPIAGRAAASAPTVFTFALEAQSARQASTWTVTFASAPTAPCTMMAQGILTRRP